MFYWYMLRQGYWLTEYLSISRVIAKSKKSYEKAFLYTEADDMDIGYFVSYNLRVLEQSFKQLQDYIKRKQNEKKAAYIYICAWVISMNVKHKLLNYMRMILKH